MSTMFVSYVGGVQHGVATGPISATTIDTGTTTQKTATAAPSGAQIAIVFSPDAAHYVATGPQATVEASAARGIYVPANTERHLAIGPGVGVAAITV